MALIYNALISTVFTILLAVGGWAWKGAGWKSVLDQKIEDLEPARLDFSPLSDQVKEVKKEVKDTHSDITSIKGDIKEISGSLKSLEKLDSKVDRLLERQT